jgi:kinesin family protein C1
VQRRKDRELRELKEELRNRDDDLQAERDRAATLKATVSQMSTTHILAESQRAALEAQVSALQSARDGDQASSSMLRLELESLRKVNAQLEADARLAEGVRRKLHNTIQELKGNIRVFCRVRPMLASDVSGANAAVDVARAKEEQKADMDFPDRCDHREIVLHGASENVMGQERKETWNFAFDRVFEPESTQAEVFEEVSQLAQSVTDGECLFPQRLFVILMLDRLQRLHFCIWPGR